MNIESYLEGLEVLMQLNPEDTSLEVLWHNLSVDREMFRHLIESHNSERLLVILKKRGTYGCGYFAYKHKCKALYKLLVATPAALALLNKLKC